METHETLFMSSPAGYRLINKVLLQLFKQDNVRKTRGAKRRLQTMLVVIGGQTRYDLNKVCWKLNASLQLEELCKIPDHYRYVGVCKAPDGFVLTGGKESTLCSMYVLSTNSWKQLKAMRSVRYAHGSIFMSGKIFVFGGNPSATSVHSLPLNGDKWTEETDLPIEVGWPEVASVENSIFLLDVHTNKLLHLDTKTKTWSHQNNLPGPNCFGARMVASNGKLLVAGGRNQTAAQYDPKADTWCKLNLPTVEHYYGALAGLDKKLYLMGGGGQDHIEEYNLDTREWSLCDMRLPKQLGFLRALTLDI